MARGMARLVFRSVVVLGLFLAPALAAQVDPPWTLHSVAAEAERLRDGRRAAAREVEQVAAYYSIAQGQNTDLYLLNLISDPVGVEVSVVNPAGQRLGLGTFTVAANQHTVLSLRKWLGSTSEEFSEGSLWLRYLGDLDTVQAWAVHREGDQKFEVPLVSPEELGGQELLSFWAAGAGARAQQYLVNVSAVPVQIVVTEGNEASVRQRFSGTLDPGEQLALRSRQARGWMRVLFDGPEGALLGAGFLMESVAVAVAPLIWSAPGNSDIEDVVHIAVRLPEGKSQLAIFNPTQETLEIEVQRLWQSTGQDVETRSLHVGPLAVGLFEMDPPPLLLGGQRLRLAAKSPFRVSGYSVLSSGEIVDLAFFTGSSAHAAGTYPIPSLEQNQVTHTLVNLADTEARIVAQVYWDGGTYSLEPFVVAPHSAHEIDFSTLAQEQRPDLLGRELPSTFAGGFFKWLARGTESALIGRAEVRPRAGADSFGFNCFGCCWAMPVGIVIPQEVEFLPGQTVNFTSAFNEETCSGTMGPFQTVPSSISSPWPFSWNGASLSATGAAYEDLTFNSTEVETRVSCLTRQRPVLGLGRGQTCKLLLKKSHDLTSFWTMSAACTAQVGDRPADKKCSSCLECCGKQKANLLCKKKNPSVVDRDFQLCQGHCYTDRC